jgi:ABC-2 type transport system permease protein
MKKILNIAKKDLMVTLNDTSALVLTLLTPFALTMVMIFAFGGSANTAITSIPVAILNQDDSDFGKALVDVFRSDELSTLVTPTLVQDPQTGREGVDGDQFAALVIIPSGFGKDITQSLATPPSATTENGSPQKTVTIEIYANPTMPTSVTVIQAIVDEFINRSTAMVIGSQVSIAQLIRTGRVPADLVGTSPDSPLLMPNPAISYTSLISISGITASTNQEEEFNWAAYMAPSMALLFLMFTMTNGGRSLLAEREAGTMQRMLASPASAVQIIGGKIFGIYLNGVVQLTILFLASLVFFQISWGPLQFVIPTILFVVAAATGWGILIASFTKTPGAANAAGTAVTLLFAISAGSFIPRQLLPQWLQTTSLISPNAWGLEAFNQIRLGAGFSTMLPFWAGMLLMFVILFIASVFTFRRQFR